MMRVEFQCRTTQYGERLSEEEEAFILGRGLSNEPNCPDCQEGNFMEGPSGGMSTNLLCSNQHCGTKVNYSGPFGFERISAASPNAPKTPAITEGPYR